MYVCRQGKCVFFWIRHAYTLCVHLNTFVQPCKIFKERKLFTLKIRKPLTWKFIGKRQVPCCHCFDSKIFLVKFGFAGFATFLSASRGLPFGLCLASQTRKSSHVVLWHRFKERFGSLHIWMFTVIPFKELPWLFQNNNSRRNRQSKQTSKARYKSIWCAIFQRAGLRKAGLNFWQYKNNF